jgi:hypothetical protein
MVPRLSVARQNEFDWKPESGDSGDTGMDDTDIGEESPEAGLAGDDLNPLRTGTGGWQLHRAYECHAERRLGGPKGRLAARHWLETVGRDPFAMTTLRKALLIEGLSLHLTNLRDQDVIEQASYLLISGRWHVCEPIIERFPVIVSAETMDARPARRAPRQAEAFVPGPEIPDPPTLLGNADQDGIAGALKDAARNGVPVCEECSR